jgi:predicted transcriptional regulator
MKSLDNTLALCEALKTNTVIKTAILRECELNDAGAEALGEALAHNHTIEDLDLQQNRLTTKGVIALADGLARNKGVKTLNIMNQTQKVLGEDALEKFISIFEANLTLTKLMWKVDSRRTWELSKLITRNVEIGRRLAGGSEIQDLLPSKLRRPSVDVNVEPAVAAVPAAAVPKAPVETAPVEKPAPVEPPKAMKSQPPSEAPPPPPATSEPEATATPEIAEEEQEVVVPEPPAETPPAADATEEAFALLDTKQA